MTQTQKDKATEKVNKAIDAVIDLESMNVKHTQYLIRVTLNRLRDLKSEISVA